MGEKRACGWRRGLAAGARACGGDGNTTNTHEPTLGLHHPWACRITRQHGAARVSFMAQSSGAALGPMHHHRYDYRRWWSVWLCDELCALLQRLSLSSCS